MVMAHFFNLKKLIVFFFFFRCIELSAPPLVSGGSLTAKHVKVFNLKKLWKLTTRTTAREVESIVCRKHLAVRFNGPSARSSLSLSNSSPARESVRSSARHVVTSGPAVRRGAGANRPCRLRRTLPRSGRNVSFAGDVRLEFHSDNKLSHLHPFPSMNRP